jgi:hypothetical protein
MATFPPTASAAAMVPKPNSTAASANPAITSGSSFRSSPRRGFGTVAPEERSFQF